MKDLHAVTDQLPITASPLRLVIYVKCVIRKTEACKVTASNRMNIFPHKHETSILMGYKWPRYCRGISVYLMIFPPHYEE